MLYILEAWMVLHLRLHHRSWSPVFVANIISNVIVVVVITSAFVGEVGRTFVFMGTAILKRSVSIAYPSVFCPSHLSYILEAVDGFVDIL
jgi:hypothetical protein